MTGKDLKAKISDLIHVFNEDIVNWEGNYNPVVYLNLLGDLKRSLAHEMRCTEKDLEKGKNNRSKKIGYSNTPYGRLR